MYIHILLYQILVFIGRFCRKKIPETNNFDITRKAGGEKLDEVILRLINFKRKGKRIYVYTKEENKWED